MFIFQAAGPEPYGKIDIGIPELIGGILLLIPKTIWAGATLTLGIMSGPL